MQGSEFRCWSSLLFSLIWIGDACSAHFAACIAGHTKGHFTGQPKLPATSYISELNLGYKLQWLRQAAQAGASSVSASLDRPALLRDWFRSSTDDKSDSVNMLLHPQHWSCGRSCSRLHDALDLSDAESWGSKLVTAWASFSFWSLAARRSRARWSGRRHRSSSVGSVVTSGSAEFLEDPSVGIGSVGSVVSFSSSFSQGYLFVLFLSFSGQLKIRS